jgi:hypothetical protein
VVDGHDRDRAGAVVVVRIRATAGTRVRTVVKGVVSNTITS